MFDSTPQSPSLSVFYKQLIKSQIPLSFRNQLGEILASSSRIKNSDLWSSIHASSVKYTKHLRFLRDHGYLPLTITFAKELVSDLVSLGSTGVFDNGPGRRTETETLANVSELQSVQRLIQDKSLYELVSLYLGAPANVHTSQAWWQYPMGPDHQPSNAQLWHRDRDDISELKLFFYGSDVDMDSGPHAFIPHSHTEHGLNRIFPASSLANPVINGSQNNFVDDSFFAENALNVPFKKWLGPAGTCFLEDTRGFHRAYIPSTTPRLLFSLVWTVGSGY